MTFFLLALGRTCRPLGPSSTGFQLRGHLERYLLCVYNKVDAAKEVEHLRFHTMVSKRRGVTR